MFGTERILVVLLNSDGAQQLKFSTDTNFRYSAMEVASARPLEGNLETKVAQIRLNQFDDGGFK